MESAQAFFRAAVSHEAVPWPEKINVDGNSATQRGLSSLATEDRRWQDVEVRARRYLRGYELTSLDVQMAYRLASETGHALGKTERVTLRIQTMLQPTTREVRWVREMLNLPASTKADAS